MFQSILITMTYEALLFFRHKSYNFTWHIVVVAKQWENRSSVDGPMEKARLISDYCDLIYITLTHYSVGGVY